MGQTDMLEDLVGMIGQDDKDMLEIDSNLRFDDFDITDNRAATSKYKTEKEELGRQMTSQRPGSSTNATVRDKGLHEKTVMI